MRRSPDTRSWALASGDVVAVRSLGAILTELEALWRGRISRIDELIAAPEPHTQQAPTPGHTPKD